MDLVLKLYKLQEKKPQKTKQWRAQMIQTPKPVIEWKPQLMHEINEHNRRNKYTFMLL